jgi:hypothetical protein
VSTGSVRLIVFFKAGLFLDLPLFAIKLIAEQSCLFSEV